MFYLLSIGRGGILSAKHTAMQQLAPPPGIDMEDGRPPWPRCLWCRSAAAWLLSTCCFVHLLCLDFMVAEKEDPVSGELRSKKSECGRYREHSHKQDAQGVAVMPMAQDRLGCDPHNTHFPVPNHARSWVALIPKGNCTYRDKIWHAAMHNASVVVFFNVGSANANQTITMPHPGESSHRTERSLGHDGS